MKIIDKIMKKRLINDQSGFIGTLILGIILLIIGAFVLMWLVQNIIPIIVLVAVAIIIKKVLFTGNVGRATGQVVRSAGGLVSSSGSYASSRIRRRVNE